MAGPPWERAMGTEGSKSGPISTVVAFDEGLSFGNVANVFVGLYRQPATLSRMTASTARLRQVVAQYPEGIGQLWVCEETSLASVGSEVTQRASELSKEFEPHTRGLAYVLEGDGFRVASARMLLSAIRLVARTQHPSRIFSKVAEGTAWLGAQVSGVDERRVMALVDELRALKAR
jgi:hypothetical protein